MAAFALPAHAGAFEDAVAKFANDDFSDTAEAIDAVAASGNPLAFPIISALLFATAIFNAMRYLPGVGKKNHTESDFLKYCLAPLIVAVTLNVGGMITALAGLSFLGLGVQPPTSDWGSMLSSSRQYMNVAPHVAALPGLAIFLAVLGFNLLGDGLRDALDPRLKL